MKLVRKLPRWLAGCLCLVPVVVFSAATSLLAQDAEATQRPASSAPKPLKEGLATFDAAWKIIYESHWDTNFNGVDWQAVRAELRPKAEAAKKTAELRGVIEDMLGRLGQSHMALIPGEIADAFDPEKLKKSAANGPTSNEKQKADGHPESKSDGENPPESSEANPNPKDDPLAARDGELGFDVRLVDGRIVVFKVDENGPAEKAGVKPGWVVQAVGRVSMNQRLEKLASTIDSKQAQFMAWRMATSLLLGKPDSTTRIDFLNGEDQPVTLEIPRRKHSGEPVKLGLLPPFYANLESQRLKSASGASVGLIRFNLWMIPLAGALDKAVEQFRDADGMVIDLRGNLGGIGGMIMGVSGHFLKDRVSLGTMKMRGNEIKFFANPRLVNPSGERVEPFSGPVAILVDGVSLSAAEIFAGGMQDIGRARVFGETSPGQALPAVWDRLPNGDVLYHAFADFVTASGTRLEGRGVIPDEPKPLSRAELLTGRDAPLQAALDWISGQRKKPAVQCSVEASYRRASIH